MPDKVSITLNDYDGEAGVFSFNVEDVEPANLSDLLDGVADLRTQIDNITRGIFISQTVTDGLVFNSSRTPAGDSSAQREDKWLVTYEDISEYLDDPTNTVINPGFHKVFKLELPTANLGLRVGNRNTIYVRGATDNVTAATNFVTALQAIAKSPYGGIMSVLSIQAVGRNV